MTNMPDGQRKLLQAKLDERARLLDSSASAEVGRRNMTDQRLRDASQAAAKTTDQRLDELNRELRDAGLMNGYGELTDTAISAGLTRPRRVGDPDPLY